MTQHRLFLALLIAASQCCTPSLAADSGKAARFYEDALSRFEKSDDAGAIVQLKNALQQDPNYLSAYLLLGQAQLRNDRPGEALLSLNTALRMGADPSEVAPNLADTYLRLGKYKELLEKVQPSGLPPRVAQSIWISRAYAHMSLGDYESTEQDFAQAAAIDPKLVDLLIAQGLYQMQRGNLTGARTIADQAIGLAPEDARGWNIRASVAHATGNIRGALEGYDRALELHPSSIDIRLARAGLLLDANRLDDAFKDLTTLQKASPEEPRSAYLRSVYYSRKGNAQTARVELLRAVKTLGSLPGEYVYGKPQLLMLGALANYGLKTYEQAQSYAEGYLHLVPGDPGARKLLASILLARGSIDAAIQHLEKANRAAPKDPRILYMLASAYMANKQDAKAANLLEDAGPQVFQQPELTSMLGYSLITQGKQEQGMEYLNNAFAKNPADLRLGNSLVMLNIQRKQTRDAVRVAEAFLARHPKEPAAQNLVGVAKAAARDVRGARSAYEKALKTDPNFVVSRLNLGKLESTEGRFDAARDQYQAILKTQPKHPQAQYEMARNELAAGRTKEAIRWLEALHAQDGSNVLAAVELANAHLAQGDADKAVAVAQQLTTVSPDNTRVLSILGRSHAAAGHLDRAKAAFANLSRQAGFDMPLLLEAASLQLSINDYYGATLSLNKALTDHPGAIAANALMAEVERRQGQIEKAMDRARRLVAANPNSGLAQRALGDTALASSRFDEAKRAYEAALRYQDSADNALQYYRALSASGDKVRARKTLQDWNRRHPNVAAVELALAEAWMLEGQFTQARSGYESYLKRHGENAVALNNYANVLGKLKDPQALAQAERAYRLAPNEPSVNDTLGWLLLQRGETERALRYLREARSRAPNSPEIRFHLAVALDKSGRNRDARSELAQALRMSTTFDGVEQARALQAQWSQ